MLVVDLNDKDNDDILNNNELQLPSESRNSFVMRADAQILSSTCSAARCPAHSVILRPPLPRPHPATCCGPGCGTASALFYVPSRQLSLGLPIISDFQV